MRVYAIGLIKEWPFRCQLNTRVAYRPWKHTHTPFSAHTVGFNGALLSCQSKAQCWILHFHLVMYKLHWKIDRHCKSPSAMYKARGAYDRVANSHTVNIINTWRAIHYWFMLSYMEQNTWRRMRFGKYSLPPIGPQGCARRHTRKSFNARTKCVNTSRGLVAAHM